MPISKTKKYSLTNSAGLRQITPYARTANDTTDTPELGFFPLQPTRYPMGTPLTAKRSKKMYSDLVDERAYLTKIREFWSNKLQDLREDHKYLCKMRDISKNKVIGIQPLFTRKEDEPLELEHPPLHNATEETIADEDAVPITKATAAEEGSDPLDLLGENIELEDLDELEKLEAMFKSKYSDDEDDEEDRGAIDDDEDEDEAKTREALSLLLQEFGDGL